MDVRTKATNYRMTPKVEDYLGERLRALEKFLGEHAALARVEVELGRDAGRPRHGANIYFAEIHITYPGGKSVYATNRSESVNGAIDDVKEEVERQLRKQTRTSRSVVRKSGAKVKRMLRNT